MKISGCFCFKSNAGLNEFKLDQNWEINHASYIYTFKINILSLEKSLQFSMLRFCALKYRMKLNEAAREMN